MWKQTPKGTYLFSSGKENYTLAASLARDCPHFSPDDEDEQTADEKVSCYNCHHRRWTQDSFECYHVRQEV